LDKDDYRNLLPLVNDRSKLQLLQEYATSRISYMHGLLEITKDQSRILEIQGAIAELRRFDTLKDEVKERAK
jgi:hypothetical protein